MNRFTCVRNAYAHSISPNRTLFFLLFFCVRLFVTLVRRITPLFQAPYQPNYCLHELVFNFALCKCKNKRTNGAHYALGDTTWVIVFLKNNRAIWPQVFFHLVLSCLFALYHYGIIIARQSDCKTARIHWTHKLIRKKKTYII